MEPLMVSSSSSRGIFMGDQGLSSATEKGMLEKFVIEAFPNNPEFFLSAFKFFFCFCGLQVSYLTWGYMQELIMTTQFTPTKNVPDGKFPSAAFCVFSNRFLAVIVAVIVVKLKHGAVFSNNTAPLLAFTPCALSNTMSSWSQYASLKYVSFPIQTVFKSSKIIPVMMMGKFLKGTSYPTSQYVEAFLITLGVAIFSVASKSSSSDTATELIGLVFLLLYITFDCFTSQWQDKVYSQYGRSNVDPYQMMLGVNSSAICITTLGLIVSGDFPVVHEFLTANPQVFTYNVVTAITSASGQLCIFLHDQGIWPHCLYHHYEDSSNVFHLHFRHCLWSLCVGHCGRGCYGGLFSVSFYQIRRKYLAR
jgi:adenosine 3'-phospho 5'-phosphosulfate transporter B2